MADAYPIVAPVISADGADTTLLSVQGGFNALTAAVRSALNTIAATPTTPSGPAGGDLAGNYPNPTVAQASGLNLFSNAANIVSQYNGVTGQAFRLFNTFTDVSNGEWLEASWAANVVTIGPKSNGTGTNRTLAINGLNTLNLQSAGVNIAVVTGGTLKPGANGSIDLGTVAAGWKRLYIDFTNTGTVGAVTISKASGRVNLAASGTSLVVTNTLVTAASKIFLSPGVPGNAAAVLFSVTPAAGSFTITATPAVTNQTAIDFFVVNAD